MSSMLYAQLHLNPAAWRPTTMQTDESPGTRYAEMQLKFG